MARAKVGSRNIVVEGVRYRWRVTQFDGPVSLSVWPTTAAGRLISASFGGDVAPPIRSGGHIYLPGIQIVITNRRVRQVILLAVTEHGYDPNAKGKPLTLSDVTDRISLEDAVVANKRWM